MTNVSSAPPPNSKMPGSDGLDVPLGDSEVAGLAKSVERYRRSRIAKGRFYTEAEREAWGRVLGFAVALPAALVGARARLAAIN